MWVHKNSTTGVPVCALPSTLASAVSRWRANRSAEQREEVGDGGAVGELVVGGGQEPFDGLGVEDAGELLGEAVAADFSATCWSRVMSVWGGEVGWVMAGCSSGGGKGEAWGEVGDPARRGRRRRRRRRRRCRPGPGPGPTSEPRARAGVELLVGVVADRDHEVVRSSTSASSCGVSWARSRPCLRASGRARLRWRRRGGCRPRSRARRWPVSTVPRPAGTGRSSRCTRTPTRGTGVTAGREQPVEGVGEQAQVGAAAVGLGPVPGHEAVAFEHAEVVGEQVRRHRQQRRQLGRGRVAETPGGRRCAAGPGRPSAAWMAARRSTDVGRIRLLLNAH